MVQSDDAVGRTDEGRLFEGQRLEGARFRSSTLQGASFVECDLRETRFRGVWCEDVEIDGYVERLVVNGVDVTGYVGSELDRRHPGRATVKRVHAADVDADGVRAAWAAARGGWPATIARARALPPGLVHERVGGEWSFVETARHMLFVLDGWHRRALLGDPAPFHPLGLAHTEMGEVAGVPHDADARPDLGQLVPALMGRFDEMDATLQLLTDVTMQGRVTTPEAPGYPEHDTYRVMRCVGAVVDETWEHRLIAERDLAVLEQGAASGTG